MYKSLFPQGDITRVWLIPRVRGSDTSEENGRKIVSVPTGKESQDMTNKKVAHKDRIN